jgi:hypothetical protein
LLGCGHSARAPSGPAQPRSTTSGTGPWIVAVLHSFEASWDGAGRIAGVILDRTGNLYGTASGGNGGSGVVFKVSPPGPSGCNHPTPPEPWCEDIIWAFPGKPNNQTYDGLYPHASLNYDSNGNLWHDIRRRQMGTGRGVHADGNGFRPAIKPYRAALHEQLAGSATEPVRFRRCCNRTSFLFDLHAETKVRKRPVCGGFIGHASKTGGTCIWRIFLPQTPVRMS